MSEAPAAFEVAFLDKLQRLLAEGDFTATYKFAVLLGLVELSVEAPLDTDTFTTRQLAEKVVALYWAQVQPFGPAAAAERASSGPHRHRGGALPGRGRADRTRDVARGGDRATATAKMGAAT